MKKSFQFYFKRIIGFILILWAHFTSFAGHNFLPLPDSSNFKQFKGTIIDSKTNNPLTFASISVSGTSIATISNSEGKFSIKIPEGKKHLNLIVSYLGYDLKVVPIKELKSEKNIVYLEPKSTILQEVVVKMWDPRNIFLGVLDNRKFNYNNDPLQMTGFYRETIRKRRSYVSLSESILNIEKQPFYSNSPDQVNLFKGRKNADYSKLDTVNFKLQGGPLSALYMDIVRYPTFVFSPEAFEMYDFTLEEITKINDDQIFVLAFKQKPSIDNPLYYGKLYIDVKSLAIIHASFNLNVEDKIKSGQLFTRKKPVGVVIYPTEVSYQINYRKQDDQWIFAYSRGDLTFKLDWDKKLFNTFYTTTFEMAITDWKKRENQGNSSEEKLPSNVIMSEKISSMTDPDFWGEYNIIEPEKSIEAAIKKIKNLLVK